MRLLQQRYDTAGGVSDSVGRSVGRLNLAFAAGSSLVAAFVGSFAVRKIVEFNDIMQQAENRLRIVTDSSSQLADVQADLFQGSQDTFQAFLTGVEIYERLARSTRDLGVSSERLVSVTETVQQAVALSGTTALAANAALIQFGQCTAGTNAITYASITAQGSTTILYSGALSATLNVASGIQPQFSAGALTITED
jgi:hypothetical protein